MLHALRLKPEQDLLAALNEWQASRDISAAAVLTCVGSLRAAHLRLANRDSGSRFNQRFEILALSGTLSPDGAHLHVSLADSDGRCIGGHVLEGCRVFTTAEIVLAELPGLVFRRHPDPATGYRELVVET
jgi:uncharacterized protein